MKDPHGRRINIGGYCETPNDAPAWEGREERINDLAAWFWQTSHSG